MNNELSRFPQHLDPKQRRQAGAKVLIHGLPPLQETLSYQISFPVAFWKASKSAAVLFLAFNEIDGKAWPRVTMGTFFRNGDLWEANKWWPGKSWPHDPIARPDSVRDLHGEAIGISGGYSDADPAPGYPAIVAAGRVAPSVKQIAVIQDGREDRRPLQSHFGAWTVCMERTSPYQLTALDGQGSVLGSIEVGGGLSGG